MGDSARRERASTQNSTSSTQGGTRSFLHQASEGFCHAAGNLDPAMHVQAKPPVKRYLSNDSKPPNRASLSPNRAFSFVVVS